MDEKKSFLKLAKYVSVFFFGGMMLIGGFVWFVDPFYHYHAPRSDMPIILDAAVYQTAGAAKNLQYDSAIVGTSMTENMHTSWFDEEMGWNTMKLSYSGARSSDLEAIFGEMSQKEGALTNVLMDINEYQLTVESWTKYTVPPEYLYDEYLYNDYQYLYNHDVVVRSVERCIDGLQGVGDNIDSAYTWEEASLFGKQEALDVSRGTREGLLQKRNGNEKCYIVKGFLSDDIEERYQRCQENLDNILPFIKNNPETNFYIMIPPYSMLYWEQKVLRDELEDTLAVYAYAVECLLQYENVKIYYFQYEPDMIINLENYRDECHHRPEYNRYMFECIRDGRNLMTLENYEEFFGKMYEFAKKYPYEEMWIE